MKISVGMATFNGAKFLQAQLDSLLEQTQLPDELIVCDDCSHDETLQILEAFVALAPFEVRIIQNYENLGYAKNFEKVIVKCSGDIIFLCDQDDIWFSEKIETVMRVFNLDEKILIVVNNAEIVTSDAKKTSLKLSDQLLSIGENTDQLLLGCCMAFRAKLKPLLSPVPWPIHGHDGWINELGNTLGCRLFIEDVLQFYRRHTNNTSCQTFTSTHKVSKLSVLNKRLAFKNIKTKPLLASLKRLEKINLITDRLIQHKNYIQDSLGINNLLTAQLNRLMKIKASYEVRLAHQRLPFFARIIATTKYFFAGGYRQFEGFKSYVRDLIN